MRAILVILLAAACGGSSMDNSGSGNGTVIQWTLAAQSTPVQTTVTAGTPVSWHNGDSTQHNVVADGAPPPATLSLSPGATSAGQTFNTPGTYPYHCSIHPLMHGTLTVQ